MSDVTSRFEWGPNCIGYVMLEYFMVITVGGLTREYFFYYGNDVWVSFDDVFI